MINCVGVIKQRTEASKVLAKVLVNTIFPHQLQAALLDVGAKFIHYSTDCVFSGAVGNYMEDDQADVPDVYGLSKYSGEVGCPNGLTLLTSIIVHELLSKRSLLEKMRAEIPLFFHCARPTTDLVSSNDLSFDIFRCGDLSNVVKRSIDDPSLILKNVSENHKLAGKYDWEATARETRKKLLTCIGRYSG